MNIPQPLEVTLDAAGVSPVFTLQARHVMDWSFACDKLEEAILKLEYAEQPIGPWLQAHDPDRRPIGVVITGGDTSETAAGVLHNDTTQNLYFRWMLEAYPNQGGDPLDGEVTVSLAQQNLVFGKVVAPNGDTVVEYGDQVVTFNGPVAFAEPPIFLNIPTYVDNAAALADGRVPGTLAMIGGALTVVVPGP